MKLFVAAVVAAAVIVDGLCTWCLARACTLRDRMEEERLLREIEEDES